MSDMVNNSNNNNNNNSGDSMKQKMFRNLLTYRSDEVVKESDIVRDDCLLWSEVPHSIKERMGHFPRLQVLCYLHKKDGTIHLVDTIDFRQSQFVSPLLRVHENLPLLQENWKTVGKEYAGIFLSVSNFPMNDHGAYEGVPEVLYTLTISDVYLGSVGEAEPPTVLIAQNGMDYGYSNGTNIEFRHYPGCTTEKRTPCVSFWDGNGNLDVPVFQFES